MNAHYYQPLDVLQQLHRQLNQAFDTRAARVANEPAATADWVPPADVYEHADRFVLAIDLPGVAQEEIEVTLEKGVLSVSGERKSQRVAEDVERSRIERVHGRFHRRFTLPDTADASNVSATARNGVLQVVIPKQAQSQPRRVVVSVAE